MACASRGLWAKWGTGLAIALFFAVCAVEVTATEETYFINFKPKSVTDPEDKWVPEGGKAFGYRKLARMCYGFMKFGKPIDVTENIVDQRSGSKDSAQRDTAYCYTKGKDNWWIEVPKGKYEVTLRMGNGDKLQGIKVNGKQKLLNAVPEDGLVQWSGEVETMDLPDGGYDAAVEGCPACDNCGLIKIRGGKISCIKTVKIEPLDKEDDLPLGCVPNPSVFSTKSISTNPCNTILVQQPYTLLFTAEAGDQISLTDKNGDALGFTMFLPAASSSSRSNFDRDYVRVSNDKLFIKGAGYDSMIGSKNDALNALGVGLDVPNSDLVIKAKMIMPPYPSGESSPVRACLWVGQSDEHFASICMKLLANGQTQVEGLYERNNSQVSKQSRFAALPNRRNIQLWARLDPGRNQITLQYKGENLPITIAQFETNPTLFSKDAAQTDFEVRTATFGGLHFEGPTSSELEVTGFEVEDVENETDEEVGDEEFDMNWMIRGISFPTALTVCKDGVLYVASATGAVYGVTLDRSRRISNRVTYKPVGDRLILGIACDPKAKARAMELWLSHTDLSQEGGKANSGVITKVWGPGFSERQNYVKNLPRSYANHANYQIHFGPDGWLYCGIGSNTAAGAANTYLNSDFSRRCEQVFSASLIRMDVTNPSFQGDCWTDANSDTDTMDETGIAVKIGAVRNKDDFYNRCKVQIIATGLRSPFDFLFWKDYMLVTDNGVGGVGAYPVVGDNFQLGSDCQGKVQEAQRLKADSGKRDDLLHRIKWNITVDNPKKVMVGNHYCGHPNPARNECIFQGGNPTGGKDFPVPRSSRHDEETWYMEQTRYKVGRTPEKDFKKAIFSFGESVSPNGIIHYPGTPFCGRALTDSVLVTYYSQSDRIQVLYMNEKKDKVLKDMPLRRSTVSTGGVHLKNPLALTTDPTHMIYVAEFFGQGVRVFDPVAEECWQDDKPAEMPIPLTKAAYEQVGEEIYIYGGESTDGNSVAMYRYNAIRDSWKKVASFNGGHAVKKPMMTKSARELYITGGLKAGKECSKHTFVFNLDSETFQNKDGLDLPTGIYGAGIFSRSQRLYIVGGQSCGGGVRNKVISVGLGNKRWRDEASMRVPRVDAQSILVDGSNKKKFFYVCGGQNDWGILNSCEVFDVDENKWSDFTNLPRPRFGGGVVQAYLRTFTDDREDEVALIFTGGYTTDRKLLTGVHQCALQGNKKCKSLKNMPGSGRGFPAVARFGGTRTFIYGGQNDEELKTNGYIFDHL